MKQGSILAGLLALALTPAEAVEAPIDDDAIVRAIESTIVRAAGVSLDPIDVTCEGGIVLLEGELGNYLAENRALRIARTTRGVQGVVDNLTVRAAESEDAEIVAAVESALRSDSATRRLSVAPTVADGIVTLKANVDSYAKRQLAETVVSQVRGVRGVENSIVVSSVDRSDAEIRDGITKRLLRDARLGRSTIVATVEDGAVRLSGNTYSVYHRDLIEGLTWVPGVKRVDSDGIEIRVLPPKTDAKPFAQPEDHEITETVSSALRLDPRVEPFRIQVHSHNGDVTLRGVVDNLKARRSASQTAANMRGVLSVKNLLRVRKGSTIADSDLQKAVQDALLRDSVLSLQDVRVVVVDDGSVRLHGEVDSHFERLQAEDVAARVEGVSDLQNWIESRSPWAGVRHPWIYDWDPYERDIGEKEPAKASSSDRDLRLSIESELFWSPFVDSDRIDVTVEDGVATLRGTVMSSLERGWAIENAYDGGAVSVKDRLVLDEPSL